MIGIYHIWHTHMECLGMYMETTLMETHLWSPSGHVGHVGHVAQGRSTQEKEQFLVPCGVGAGGLVLVCSFLGA